MRQTTTILLAILILCQSCYSYKKVDLQNLKIDATKKYAIKITNRKTKHIGEIIKVTDKSIILQKRKNKIMILKNTIKKIEEYTFSETKTGIAGMAFFLPIILRLTLGKLFSGSSSIRWK